MELAGAIRADVVHEKLIGLGYAGAPQTTRRAVAQAKRDWRVGRRVSAVDAGFGDVDAA